MTMNTQDATRRNRWRWVGVGAVVAVFWSTPLLAQQQQPLLDALGQVREEAYDHLRRTLVTQTLRLLRQNQAQTQPPSGGHRNHQRQTKTSRS